MRVKDKRSRGEGGAEKQKPRPEVSDYDPVPLYRSYGVTRREYPIINKIKTAIQQFTVIILLLPSCIVLAFGIAMTVLYGKALAFVLFTPMLLFFTFKLTKSLRRRRSFLKKLKKLVKKESYKLTFKRGFLASFFWSPSKEYFVLDTPKYSYHVYVFTSRKYNSEIVFESAERFMVVKRPLRKIFSLALGLKTKIKEYTFAPDRSLPMYSRVKIIGFLANPVCDSISYRRENGALEPTGSGGNVFGSVVFTGTGFIETVKRNEEST